MDPYNLEALAVETYERHRLDPAEPVSTYKLARLSGHRIVRPPKLLGRYPSTTFHDGEGQCIAIRRTVPDDEAQWYVGHELAHLLLGKPHGAGAEIEAACDHLGAALMAPRPAVLALHRALGFDVSALATEVVATQTWAALRLGETLSIPLVTVGPIAVRVRGPESWAWPDEPQLRRWAAGRPGPGLRKVRVTDRPKRTILHVL